MKLFSGFLCATVVGLWCGVLPAEDPQAAAQSGTLLFEDDFDRDEQTPDKEDVGPGWRTNSAWRAGGRKQVDLDGGAMHITRVPEADHGVAIFHDVDFQDGRVELRFKLGTGDDLGIDFVDRSVETIHAGHLCVARVRLTNLTLTDSMTGAMDLKIRERRLAGDKSPELAELIKSKTAGFPIELKADQWYTLSVTVEGDAMRAAIDGKPIGEFRSPGMAHPTKKMITLAVNRSAWVDDVRVWKLK